MDAQQATEPPRAHELVCMEVWGGNEAVEKAVSVPGVDAWICSRPHGGAAGGGDIHYVSMCAAGTIVRFAVADVAGHGQSVSELAVRLRDLMRRNINTLNQARFARALNELFGREDTHGRFATAILATYHTPTDHLILCNAGHPAPLWYRASERTWRLFTPDTPGRAERVANLPLGIIDPTEYEQFAVRLGAGDLVVMYTDSLIEACGANGDMLGESGLLKLANGLAADAPQEFAASLIAASGAGQDDDTTVLVLHHNASNPPRQGVWEKMRMTAKVLGIG